MAHVARYLRWRLLLVLALLLAEGSVALAQPPPPPVRFTVFAAKPIGDLAFAPRMGAAAQKVSFYPTARSPKYEYRGAMPLRFFDASGAVVAEATIPADMREALLLFTPVDVPATEGAGVTQARDAKDRKDAKKKPALRYQVAVLDDGAARHAAGALSIINLSGLALSGTVNREEVTLRPGLNPTVAVGRSGKVTLRTTFNKRVYQSYAGTFTLSAKQRALLILFPPFYKGSLEVQSRLLVDEPIAPPR